MRTILSLFVALLFVAGCGGTEQDSGIPPEENPEIQEEVQEETNHISYTEDKYYFPPQCVTQEHIADFRDDVPPRREFSTAPTIHFVRGRVPRHLREGDFVWGDITSDGIERLKQSTRECVEALNWALPDEFGEIEVSGEEVPEGNYRYGNVPRSRIYIDLNYEAIEDYQREYNHPYLVSGFADGRYVVLSDRFGWLLDNEPDRGIDPENLTPKPEQEKILRETICHELMHVFGFLFHPDELIEDWELEVEENCVETEEFGRQCYKEIVNWFPQLAWSVLSSGRGGGYNDIYIPYGVGPHRVLAPIDVLALRRLYGGNDLQEWLERLTPPDCPSQE